MAEWRGRVRKARASREREQVEVARECQESNEGAVVGQEDWRVAGLSLSYFDIRQHV